MLEFYSRKQKRVVRSTLGAECRALSDGVDLGKVICSAVHELLCGPMTTVEARDTEINGGCGVPLEACTDARSLFETLQIQEPKAPTEVAMVFDLMALRESLECHRLSKLWWLDTRDMLADGLTKGIINRSALLTICQTGKWDVAHSCLEFQAVYRPLVEGGD